MKRHSMIAAFVIALAAHSLGQQDYSDPQDSQNQAAGQPNATLSKKERKQMEKEDKKAHKQERKEENHEAKQQAKEQRKQDKEQEKQVAKERNRELKEEHKEVSAEQKKDQKYQREEAQQAEKAQAQEMNRQIAREGRMERASAAATPAQRYVYVPRVPVSTTATPGLLVAQREVSRAIYSQLPGSDVRVLLNDGNQIVLRGSAPTPSWRSRLLQLAVGAARGYSVLDQLAATLVSDAAGSATSAAIGGVSNLIHGSGAKNSAPESGTQPPPDSASSQQAPASSQQALPDSDLPAPASALDAGTNACVNMATSSQAMLTGQATSLSSADLIRRFAHQLASPSVPISDQLAVRTNGVPSAGNAPPEVASTSAAATVNANPAATAVSPGSTICLTENAGEIFLTGTVGSTVDLGTVENAVQPLVGSGRLLDHLTIAGLNSGTQIATSTSVSTAGEPTPPVHPSAAQPSETQQTEVEQAVHSIPRLANVNVQVAGDGVHLSGSVDSTEDDQIAANLARQYAPGLPLTDNVAVANRSEPPRF